MPTLPTGLSGDGAGIGREIAAAFAGYCHGAVAGKVTGPVVEPCTERLFDKQATKAGAIDEEVARQGGAVFECQRSDVATLAVLFDTRNQPLVSLHSPRFSEPAQIGSIKPDIEMIGIGQFG